MRTGDGMEMREQRVEIGSNFAELLETLPR